MSARCRAADGARGHRARPRAIRRAQRPASLDRRRIIVRARPGGDRTERARHQRRGGCRRDVRVPRHPGPADRAGRLTCRPPRARRGGSPASRSTDATSPTSRSIFPKAGRRPRRRFSGRVPPAIVGRVEDIAGLPVSGACVVLLPENPRSAPRMVHRRRHVRHRPPQPVLFRGHAAGRVPGGGLRAARPVRHRTQLAGTPDEIDAPGHAHRVAARHDGAGAGHDHVNGAPQP